jgi:Mn2+/Fe2+ NRAMP family transporter
VTILADTDAGSLITVAQSGAQWSYRILLSNLLFIPFMFFAQEIAVRVGLGARQGAVELARRRFGRAPALLLLAVLAASCFGALVSELSGLAGAGQAVGAPVGATMALAFFGLMAMVATGSYRSVERMARFFGLFEIAFLAMAWRAAPGFQPVLPRRCARRRATPNFIRCSPPISAPASFRGRCCTSNRRATIRGLGRRICRRRGSRRRLASSFARRSPRLC